MKYDYYEIIVVWRKKWRVYFSFEHYSDVIYNNSVIANSGKDCIKSWAVEIKKQKKFAAIFCMEVWCI